MDIIQKIKEELKVEKWQVDAAVKLGFSSLANLIKIRESFI